MATSSNCNGNLVVGIDASNLIRGGGLTHLVELLSVAEPERYGVRRVIVWGTKTTISKLSENHWLQLESPNSLNRGNLSRLAWQRYRLARTASQEGCHVLFVPGGNFSGGFHPIVTMSRNMLPFEWRELRRYGVSLAALRLFVLRLTQTRTLRRADGVIFLNDYARDSVCKITGALPGVTAIIPHGRHSRFELPPKPQRSIDSYSQADPLRMIYVSIVDQYKHQWNVVEAVNALRKAGWFVQLDLVGPAYRPAMLRLRTAIDKYDPLETWVKYHGPIEYEKLHQIYSKADLGIFASSCENLPNILLETMSAGLPIACSNRGPMPEILKQAGLYFDPEDPVSIESTLHELVASTELRQKYALAAYEASQHYSWSRCASETFSMLSAIGRAHLLPRTS